VISVDLRQTKSNSCGCATRGIVFPCTCCTSFLFQVNAILSFLPLPFASSRRSAMRVFGECGVPYFFSPVLGICYFFVLECLRLGLLRFPTCRRGLLLAGLFSLFAGVGAVCFPSPFPSGFFCPQICFRCPLPPPIACEGVFKRIGFPGRAGEDPLLLYFHPEMDLLNAYLWPLACLFHVFAGQTSPHVFRSCEFFFFFWTSCTSAFTI